MEEDRRRLLHFLLKYKIYINIIFGPCITSEREFWIVGPDVNVDGTADGIGSKNRHLTIPPRSGWEYWYGTDWVLDDTLLFLPGGPRKE